jgi:hypothetical protein
LSQALKDGDKIECVVRETGINQDGRTTSITMPDHNAQEALIRATYARAGLDITNPEERCQFFEAHGRKYPQHLEVSVLQFNMAPLQEQVHQLETHKKRMPSHQPSLDTKMDRMTRMQAMILYLLEASRQSSVTLKALPVLLAF